MALMQYTASLSVPPMTEKLKNETKIRIDKILTLFLLNTSKISNYKILECRS